MEKKVNKLGGSFFEAKTIKAFFQDFFKEKNETEILFVVSAMKGITRLLRLIFIVKTEIKIDDELKNLMISLSLNDFQKSHLELIEELFSAEEKEKAKNDFKILLANLNESLEKYKRKNGLEEDKFYAHLLQFGELASSRILSQYLNTLGVGNLFFDARDYVLTNDDYRESKILEINPSFLKFFQEKKVLITQGFIGRNAKKEDTVIGFDGSDYSAARFANTLGENKNVTLTFWKDVNGVYTENPTKNPSAELIPKMTREEYLKNVVKNNSFVVRPDSILELDKQIEVEIRSFLNLKNTGTKICA